METARQGPEKNLKRKAGNAHEKRRSDCQNEGKERCGGGGAEWASRVRRATMASSIFIRTSNKTNHHSSSRRRVGSTSLLRVLAKSWKTTREWNARWGKLVELVVVVGYGRSSARKQAMPKEKWNKANWSWLLVLNCVWFNISKVYVTTTMTTRRDNYYAVVMLKRTNLLYKLPFMFLFISSDCLIWLLMIF